MPRHFAAIPIQISKLPPRFGQEGLFLCYPFVSFDQLKIKEVRSIDSQEKRVFPLKHFYIYFVGSQMKWVETVFLNLNCDRLFAYKCL